MIRSLIWFSLGALISFVLTHRDPLIHYVPVHLEARPIMQPADLIPRPEDKTCRYTRPDQHARTYTIALQPGQQCLTVLQDSK